jgi:hypothetical protein
MNTSNLKNLIIGEFCGLYNIQELIKIESVLRGVFDYLYIFDCY